MEISSAENLAVSIYLPNQTEPATWHPRAFTTSYVSAGDNAAAIDVGSTQTITSWPYLTDLLVTPVVYTGVIVALGDSITDGYGSTTDTNGSWPSQFFDAIQQSSFAGTLAVVNSGISGNRVLHDNYGLSALTRFQRDVLEIEGVRYVILFEGINDISDFMGDYPVTADQVIAGYQRLIADAHVGGIKIYGATLTPIGIAVHAPGDMESTRLAVNQWIRTSGAFDGVLDFEAAVRDPSNPESIIPSLTVDNVHLNSAGYGVLANSIDLTLFQ